MRLKFKCTHSLVKQQINVIVRQKNEIIIKFIYDNSRSDLYIWLDKARDEPDVIRWEQSNRSLRIVKKRTRR